MEFCQSEKVGTLNYVLVASAHCVSVRLFGCGHLRRDTMLVNIPCFVLQLFGSLEEPLKEANANKNVTEDAGQSGVLGETYSFCLVDENCRIALHCTIQGMVQRSMGSVNEMWKCLYWEITYEFWKFTKCPWKRKFIRPRIQGSQGKF